MASNDPQVHMAMLKRVRHLESVSVTLRRERDEANDAIQVWCTDKPRPL